MTQITQQYLNRLDALYANGQFEGIAPGEMKVLTNLDMERIISEAELVAPGTFFPVDEDTRQELKRLIERKLIPFDMEDIRYLSTFGAETLIWLGMSGDQNRENTISPSQQKRIKSLIAKGFLRKLSAREIRLLSEEKADKLIQQGEELALYGRKGY